MNKFTPEQRAKLVAYLASHELSEGLGDKESACALASINLAIDGRLTDSIPACMSKALGHATIRLQDAMPAKMRNSARFKNLLPDMAGTGRGHEKERAAIILNWMWKTVLPQLQGVADENGFGDKWRKMCKERTEAAADAAASAATYAASADAAAGVATYAASADAAGVASAASADAAGVASAATYAATYAAYAAADAAFWEAVDPIGVLERMTYLEATQ